jgi:hypothetical protein
MAGVVTLLLATNSVTGFSQELKGGVTGKPAVVAPIFEHGEGRGVIGCQVINPPYFLSEQDAMQVIREELRKGGVAPFETKVPVESVRITPQWSDDVARAVPTPQSRIFTLDAFDPQKRVGIEYVNSANYFDLGGKRSTSTVQGYSFEELAGTLSKTVGAKAHDIYFGAFYDPAIYLRGDAEARRRLNKLYKERSKLKDSHLIAQKDEEIGRAYDDMLAPARAASRDMLQHQVKDFIDWLKGQGVI